MKKLLTFIATVAISTSLFAQMTNKDKAIKVAEEFKLNFNQAKDETFYKLISPEFQKQLSLKDYKSFMADLRKDYGLIKKINYSVTRNGTHEFKSEHEKLTMALLLNVNEAGLVNGLQIAPFQEKQTIRKEYATDNPKKDSLDIIVDKTVKDYMQTPANCGLSIAVLKEGKTTYYNYGEVKRDSKQLPNSKTIYEIGSISKSFTGLLLAKAIEDGKLKLQDDIRKYLPASCKNLMAAKSVITIQHLVTHTSGIPSVIDNMMKAPYDSLNPYSNYNKERVMNDLSKLTITEISGIKFKYSNLGMGLLGIILCEVYQKDYETLVQEIIVKQAEMKVAKINLNDEEKLHFAEGYNEMGMSTPHWDLGALPAAGALRSTSEDMLLYMQANMNADKGFMYQSHQVLFEKERDKAGMAWMIVKTKVGNTLVCHNGGTFGFSSFAGFIKEKKCAVVVLSNSGNNADALALGILKYLQR
jgi:CubicO group peptidase (beta-lactamase class C family)